MTCSISRLAASLFWLCRSSSHVECTLFDLRKADFNLLKELLRVEILDSDGCHDLVSLLLDGFLESELTSVASAGLYKHSSIYVRLFMLLFTGDSSLRSYLIHPESGCGDILKSAFMKALDTLATHKEEEECYMKALNQLKLVSSVYMQCCAEDSSGFMKLFVGDEDCSFLEKKEDKEKEVKKQEQEQEQEEQETKERKEKEGESSEAKEEEKEKQEEEEEKEKTEEDGQSNAEEESKKSEEKVDESIEETKEPEKEEVEENANDPKQEPGQEPAQELNLQFELHPQEQSANPDSASCSSSSSPIGRRLWCVLCDIVLGDYLSIELNVRRSFIECNCVDSSHTSPLKRFSSRSEQRRNCL